MNSANEIITKNHFPMQFFVFTYIRVAVLNVKFSKQKQKNNRAKSKVAQQNSDTSLNRDSQHLKHFESVKNKPHQLNSN